MPSAVYVPKLHCVHSDENSIGACVPGAQVAQDAADALLYVPTLHGSQTTPPIPLPKEPAPQIAHMGEPMLAAVVPAGHSLHDGSHVDWDEVTPLADPASSKEAKRKKEGERRSRRTRTRRQHPG